MRRIITFGFLAGLGLLAAIIPGCDQLVTKETHTFDSTTVIVYDSNCVKVCHEDVSSPMEVAIRQWNNSGHSSDSLVNFTYFGSNTSSCGEQCHTADGFVNSLGGAPDTSRYPTEIGCFACHRPHTTFDFTLRDTSSVILANSARYDRKPSNICARCHKATNGPAQSVSVPALITHTWGPHAATQAEMLLGTGGYEYPESTYTSSSHKTSVTRGCIDCHRDYSRGFALGGHSLRMSDGADLLTDACNRTGCHVTTEVSNFTNYNIKQLTYRILLDSLRIRLIAANLIDSTTNQPIVGTIETTALAGALYNYLFVNNDRSHGVHNTQYGLTLLKQSLADLGP